MNDAHDPVTEPLEDRLWRQVEHGLDAGRLLPTINQRRKALAKKLDRPLEKNGWRIFVSGQAFAITHGKAKAKKGAEVMLVRTVARWTDEVAAVSPERMGDLRRLVAAGLAAPQPVQGR